MRRGRAADPLADGSLGDRRRDLRNGRGGAGIGPAVAGVSKMIDAIAEIHGLDVPGRPSVHNPSDEPADLHYSSIPSADAWDSSYRSNATVVGPRPVRQSFRDPLRAASPRAIPSGEFESRTAGVKDGLVVLLGDIFRKVEFKEGQIEIIKRALELKPVVGLLPTAGGKSLCYQLVSFLQPGFTVIVDIDS